MKKDSRQLKANEISYPKVPKREEKQPKPSTISMNE
jgi:hypothetical protein